MGDSGPRTAIVTLSHGARSRGTAYGHSTPPGHPCHAHPPASSLGRLAPRGSPGSTVCPPQGWCSSKQWTCDRCLEAENGPKSDDVYRMYDGAYQHRRSSSCFSKVQVNTSTVTSKGTSIEPSTCGTWQGTFSSERPRTTVKITPQVKTVPSPPKPVHLIPVPHLHSRAGSGHGFCQFGFGASTRAASTATKKVDGHNGRRGPGQKMASKCTCGWSGQADREGSPGRHPGRSPLGPRSRRRRGPGTATRGIAGTPRTCHELDTSIRIASTNQHQLSMGAKKRTLHGTCACGVA